MNWHTFYVSGAVSEHIRTAHHSHAVNLDTMRPFCNRVAMQSLVFDDSIAKPGELPTCPLCVRALAKLARTEPCPRCDLMRGRGEIESKCVMCGGTGRVQVGNIDSK
jgi:hypothetical protein